MDDRGKPSVWAFAARHHGVFTRSHALDAGLSHHEIDRCIANGEWQVLHRAVYLDAATPRTWRGDLLAACWAGGTRSAASHRSALALHGLPGARMGVVEIVTPRWRRARHAEVLAHETRDLPDTDLVTVDGIPVTAPARTLIDAAAVLHASTLELAVDEALRRGVVAFEQLAGRLEEMARPGRRGIGALRRVLGQRHPTAQLTESVRELLLVKAIETAGLPRPALQHEVRDGGGSCVARVDAAYPTRRIAVEYDSYLHHGARRKHVRDLARRNALTAAGWTVVHVTGPDLESGAKELCAALRSLLDPAA
jgi:predicted transcriptional regulator of viral defense system